ncbi:DUF2382 domain-containing protein [Arthrobacter sp. TB 23]|uniref:DUF2382 domain-containing protein n=1 Tax=Arthrobacter sp. TB 23 TaxID=494419 RepID=UPI0002E2EC58|nr:PRC and DUF2382 domain-containing protein [Arthrobacter sp. TB 23]
MLTTDHIDRILNSGGNVIDNDGAKVGSVGQIYLDDQSGNPSWVTVKTGMFGTSESFAPLEGAEVDGDDVRVGYSKDQIKDAPRVDPDADLSAEEESRLYQHYGLSGSASTGNVDQAGTVPSSRNSDFLDGPDSETRAGTGRVNETGNVGHDTSGPTTDDAMTRSEERLNIGTESREVGRARLRKHVVTEMVTKTVPVTREEVTIEREPITDANRGDATSGPDISEEEHEVILHAETPVVEKDTVAVERVRLGKETVTDEKTVTEEVRKEQIDTDADPARD